MTDKLRAAAEAALEALESHTAIKHPQQIRYRDSAIEQLRAALAEQEAEPVAWGMQHSDGRIYDCIAPGEHDREPGQYTVPLYTLPPRREWQGLTDEEVKFLWEFPPELSWIEAVYAAIRKAEAALKEKNHDTR